MTLIKQKKPLKVVPLPVTADLSPTSLSIAATLAHGYPNDGSAELVVHESGIVNAIRVASAHNTRSTFVVRVVVDKYLGRSDWKLRTAGVVIASIWTAKSE